MLISESNRESQEQTFHRSAMGHSRPIAAEPSDVRLPSETDARAISALAALFDRDHEFQPRPHRIDGADLDVDQAGREPDLAHCPVIKVGRDA